MHYIYRFYSNWRKGNVWRYSFGSQRVIRSTVNNTSQSLGPAREKPRWTWDSRAGCKQTYEMAVSTSCHGTWDNLPRRATSLGAAKMVGCVTLVCRGYRDIQSHIPCGSDHMIRGRNGVTWGDHVRPSWNVRQDRTRICFRTSQTSSAASPTMTRRACGARWISSRIHHSAPEL